MQFRHPTVLLVKSLNMQVEGVIIQSLSLLNTLFFYLKCVAKIIEMFPRSSRLPDGRG